MMPATGSIGVASLRTTTPKVWIGLALMRESGLGSLGKRLSEQGCLRREPARQARHDVYCKCRFFASFSSTVSPHFSTAVISTPG